MKKMCKILIAIVILIIIIIIVMNIIKYLKKDTIIDMNKIITDGTYECVVFNDKKVIGSTTLILEDGRIINEIRIKQKDNYDDIKYFLVLGLIDAHTHITNEEELNNDTKLDFEEIDNDVNFDFEEISNEEEIDNDITYEKTKTKKSSSGLFVKSYDKQVIDKARDNIETARSFLEENEEELSNEQKKLIRDNLALIYVKLNKARNDKNHQRFDLYQDDIEELDSISNSLLDSVFDYTFPKTKTR